MAYLRHHVPHLHKVCLGTPSLACLQTDSATSIACQVIYCWLEEWVQESWNTSAFQNNEYPGDHLVWIAVSTRSSIHFLPVIPSEGRRDAGVCLGCVHHGCQCWHETDNQQCSHSHRQPVYLFIKPSNWENAGVPRENMLTPHRKTPAWIWTWGSSATHHTTVLPCKHNSRKIPLVQLQIFTSERGCQPNSWNPVVVTYFHNLTSSHAISPAFLQALFFPVSI